MSNYPPGRGPRPADPHQRLRLAALAAVILGVVLLAAAAFVLSYSGIHQIALNAGVSPGLARIYPLIFDAMLVIAGAAALALRGAGWWARSYAWASLLLLLAAVATGDAVHATHVALPVRPSRAAVAITPWVLLLLAFGLWLEMLRHFRKTRTAGALARTEAAVPPEPAAPGETATAGHVRPASQPADQEANGGAGPGAGRTAVTWAAAGGAGEGQDLPRPRSGLDTLLGPKDQEHAPVAAGQPQHETGDYPDPVSYGEETGYVHPESYHGYPAQDEAAGQGGYPDDYPPGDHAGLDDHPGAGDYPGQDEDQRHAAAANPGPAGDSASDEPPAAAEPAAAGAVPPAKQDAAAHDEATQQPAPPANPWLERLRSTPAPPGE